jgi:hypothetical protein
MFVLLSLVQTVAVQSWFLKNKPNPNTPRSNTSRWNLGDDPCKTSLLEIFGDSYAECGNPEGDDDELKFSCGDVDCSITVEGLTSTTVCSTFGTHCTIESSLTTECDGSCRLGTGPIVIIVVAVVVVVAVVAVLLYFFVFRKKEA